MNAIIDEVARRGRVSFEEFMELALYHPTGGYYTRKRPGPGPVGGEGDFITAPTAAPLFAATMARLLGGLARGIEGALTLVELGAGEGIFLQELGERLGPERDAVLARVVAVERASWARRRLKERCAWVEVAESLAGLPTPVGPVVLFASELYDALPCRSVCVTRSAELLVLAEHFVEVAEDGNLCWVLDEPRDGEAEAYLSGNGVSLHEGQVAEVRVGLRAAHADHLAWCGRNAIALIVDYGYPARKLYNPRGRAGGSLTGYREHQRVDRKDVLLAPGEVDITAHVNFDDLDGAAADTGWSRGDVRPLAGFLVVHGATELLPERCRTGEPLGAQEWAELAAAKRLLVPTGMGVDLKVLAQGTGALWRVYRRLATPPPQWA